MRRLASARKVLTRRGHALWRELRALRTMTTSEIDRAVYHDVNRGIYWRYDDSDLKAMQKLCREQLSKLNRS